MHNENLLRDELDIVKDRCNKLLQLEATVEVYKNRLKEIPELKAKLLQAQKANEEYEEMHGDGSVDAEEIVKLQDCVKYLK